MIFFKGGMTYEGLMNMPLPELQEWIDVGIKIIKEDEREAKRKG